MSKKWIILACIFTTLTVITATLLSSLPSARNYVSAATTTTTTTPLYAVQFTNPGPVCAWGITADGITKTASITQTSITINLPAGNPSYTWQALAGTYVPAGNSVVVVAGQMTFTGNSGTISGIPSSLYVVSYTQTNGEAVFLPMETNPAPSTYTVSIGGFNVTGDINQQADVYLQPGQYPYTVSCSSGYMVNPSSGTANITANGTVDVTEQFTANLGTLNVTISGLPSTLSVEQSITGPGNYSDLITLQGGQTQVIPNLTPGQYSVVPAVEPGYQNQSNYVATVNGGSTTTVTVVYTPVVVTTPPATTPPATTQPVTTPPATTPPATTPVSTPKVILIQPPSPYVVGASIIFNGVATTTSPATISKIVFNFGDGSPVYTGWFLCTHTYTQAGSYVVTVTATDSNGQTASASETLNVVAATTTVAPTKPTITLFTPTITGMNVNSNGVTLPTSSGATTVSIQWAWGDGIKTTSWFPGVHTYSQNGTYTITVTATDSNGLSASASETVTIGTVTTVPTTTPVTTPVTTSTTYNLTISCTAGGTTTPAPGTYKEQAGSSIWVSITPAAGFTVSQVLVNGAPVSSANYEFTNISSNNTYSVTFSPITCLVSAFTTTIGGTVSPATQTVNSGSSASITITPTADFGISNIVDNGVQESILTPAGSTYVYVIQNVTAAHNVQVAFSGLSSALFSPVTTIDVAASQTGHYFYTIINCNLYSGIPQVTGYNIQINNYTVNIDSPSAPIFSISPQVNNSTAMSQVPMDVAMSGVNLVLGYAKYASLLAILQTAASDIETYDAAANTPVANIQYSNGLTNIVAGTTIPSTSMILVYYSSTAVPSITLNVSSTVSWSYTPINPSDSTSEALPGSYSCQYTIPIN